MTNYERIKAMSVEEMANFIAEIQIREGIDPDIPEDWQTVENISKGQLRWQLHNINLTFQKK